MNLVGEIETLSLYQVGFEKKLSPPQVDVWLFPPPQIFLW